MPQSFCLCVLDPALGLTTAKNEKKSRLFTCPSHTIYRVEAVGPSLSIYTFKITSVSMLNLGQFREIDVLSITT